jgi:RNA polymerase sigma-70 factor, ECF subfamily
MSNDPQRDLVTRELVQALPMLRAFLRHLGASADQLEEAVQETAVWCCGHSEQFEAGTNFGAWIRSVAKFRLLALWRAAGRADAALDPILAEAIPDQEWDAAREGANERAQALNRCLEGLSESSQRLVALTYGEGLGAAEVARQLRATVDIVYTTLSRLRRRLRTCVERRLDHV